MTHFHIYLLFFLFTTTVTTVIYTLSLHDALPIYFIEEDYIDLTNKILERIKQYFFINMDEEEFKVKFALHLKNLIIRDRKSTRLNSSHVAISYAVFCLKKKNICI